MSKSTDDGPEDVMALAGLRRLVLHARDQLAATAVEPKWTYSHDAWSPGQIKSFTARKMAESVLTLVADCLPGDAGISADEAAERERKAAQAVEREQRKAQALADQLEAAQQAKAEADAQVDAAVTYQTAAEEEAEAWSAQWQRLLSLAQTDVPAAMRYLMAGGDEEAVAAEPETDEAVTASR